MSCEKSSLKKYLSRPGPPIPATSCMLGQIKKGNDGNNYQLVEFNSKSGKSKKWLKIGLPDKSKNNVKNEVKQLLIDKTPIYTLQLNLLLPQEFHTPPLESKTFLESKMNSIMDNLLGSHIQDNVNISINLNQFNVRNAIILYKFHYTKSQLDKNKIYYNEDVRDTEGNIELDEDDFIRTIYESKLVNGQLIDSETYGNWYIDNYWTDIKLVDNIAKPKVKAKVTIKVKAKPKPTTVPVVKPKVTIKVKAKKPLVKSINCDKTSKKCSPIVSDGLPQYNTYNVIFQLTYDAHIRHPKFSKDEQYIFLNNNEKIKSIVYDIADGDLLYTIDNISFNKSLQIMFTLKINAGVSSYMLNSTFSKISNITKNDIKENLNDSIKSSSNNERLYYGIDNGDILNGLFKLNIKNISLSNSYPLVSINNTKKVSVKKVCPPGKVLRVETNRCVKSLKEKEIKLNEIKVCPPGKVLRVETNRCVKSLKKISKMVDGANKKLKQSNTHK